MADLPTGPFDFSSMEQLLNDPNIKEMAEQISKNPAFEQMTQALQNAMQAPEGAATAGQPPLDPAQYAKAMSSILENQDFMKMAENLGRRIMEQDPNLSNYMSTLQNPAAQNELAQKMNELKEDPELAPILKEIEEMGPSAMMKYWEDPEIMAKFGKAMESAMAGGPLGLEGEEEEEEEEEMDDLHHNASSGNVDRLKELLKEGAFKDAVDEEGRTPLHFAAGYGELECVKALLDVGANIDALDNNQNTPLHYAAGYGQPESVKLLTERNAKVDAKNADGKTAAEVAELNTHDDVVKLLESFHL